MMNMRQQANMLREIQKEDFMVEDLQLYLDTHPFDRRALAEYNRHTMHSADLRRQYEQLYGPLKVTGRCTTVQYPWRWVEEPWPWEIEY